MTTTKDSRPPRGGADEKTMLVAFLDYLRTAIADKIADVPEPQIRTAGVPSGTNLLGLVKHLTYVERAHFLGEWVDDWDRTMQPRPEETVDSVLAGYREAVKRTNEVIDACADLGAPHLRAPSMRWILVHMIEETGRHAGHADILREQIDGATGR